MVITRGSDDKQTSTILSKETKRKRVDIGEDDSARPRQKLKQKKTSLMFPKLKTRNSPKCLVDTVRELNEKQKSDVKEIGFESLLSLTIDKLPSTLGYWVVDNFDHCSCSLVLPDGAKVHITPRDVYLTLGIPMGARKIDSNARLQKSELLKNWRKQFKTNESTISIRELSERIINAKKGGIWFKRNFVVLLVTVLVQGSQNRFANQRILRYLEDVDGIKNLNFCEYVVDSLIEGKKYWNKKHDRHFPGSLLFLELFYVDRVVHEKRKVPRQFPIFTTWSTQLLSERSQAEKESGFGHGHLEPAYDLEIEKKETNENHNNERELSETPYEDATQTPYEDATDFIEDFAKTANELAQTMRKFDQKVKLAQEKFHTNETIKKILETANGLINNFSAHTSQQVQQEVFTASQLAWWSNPSVIDAMEEFERARGIAKHRQPHKGQSSRNERVEDMQSLDGDVNQKKTKRRLEDDIPTFDLGIKFSQDTCEESPAKESARKKPEKSVKQVIATKQTCSPSKRMRSSPRFQPDKGQSSRDERAKDMQSLDGDVNQKKTKRRLEDDIPTFDLGIKFSQDTCKESPAKEGSRKKPEKSAKQVIATKQTCSPSKPKRSSPRFEVQPFNPVQGHPATTATTTEQATPIQVHVPETRAFRRGQMMSQLCKSPYVDRILDANKVLTKDEKMLSKWIFDEEVDGSLEAFRYKEHEAYISNFKTFRKGAYIVSIIIDIWAAILNQKEIYRNEDSPTRFFFGTWPCMYELWKTYGSMEKRCEKFKNWLDFEMKEFNLTDLKSIDLVFFPIHYKNHYFLVCFNLKNLGFHVIDNMEWGVSLKASYGTMLPHLRNFFSRYLQEGGHPRAASVAKLVPNVINMPWKNKVNVVDCGIYTMRHMETYMGNGAQGWDCQLKKTNFKALDNLRIRYCHEIITFEENEYKDQVLEAMKAYYDQN